MSCFVDGGRKLAGHAADTNDADAVTANELVDVIRRDSFDDHIEDMHVESLPAQPSGEVDVVQRDVLDIPVEGRRRSNEGKHRIGYCR